jgi:L-lactate dehydrogenase complex protein LldG
MTDDLLNKFCEELKNIGGCSVVVQNETEISLALNGVINAYNAKSVIFGSHSCIRKYFEKTSAKECFPNVTVNEISDFNGNPVSLREALSKADIGVSYSVCGIAETGSVVLLSSSYEPRTLSLLPATSIIITDKKNIVSDLNMAMEKIKTEGGLTNLSCITIISGPSRTADIEKILITGVHGPKALHVIIVDE